MSTETDDRLMPLPVLGTGPGGALVADLRSNPDVSGFTTSMEEERQLRRNSFKFCRKTSLPGRKIDPETCSILSLIDEQEEQLYDHSMSVSVILPQEKILRSVSNSSGKSIIMRETSINTSKDGSFHSIDSIDSLELDDIALSVLGTISHPSAPGNMAYLAYLQKVLKIPDDRMRTLCKQAEKKENTVLQLVCHVKSATQLQPKDLKVLPDTVCHLTVASRDKQMDPSFCSHNVLEWQQKGWVREVKKTKFASATLSPTWQETFNLELSDPAEEMVVVEIWGKKNKELRTSSSQKHKEYYLKQSNFIGRAFYVLRTTPIEGEERTLTLFSHSGKHERGKVVLKLSIKGQKEDNPMGVSLREHSILHKMIADHESRQNGAYVRSWDTKMSVTAKTILEKHAELASMSRFQEASIRLNILLEYHSFNKVKLAPLAELLEEMVLLETDLDPKHLWVKQLLYDLQSLQSQMVELIRGHLVQYNIKARSDVDDISSAISILKSVYSFPSLVNKLKDMERDLKTTLNICIQVAVPRWFLQLSKRLLVDRSASYGASEEGELELLALKGLCAHCLRQAVRAHRTLNPIFERVGVNYFTQFYVTLDKLLCGEAMPRVRHFTNKEREPIIYELYVVMKDYAKLSQHIPQSYHKCLEILTFHENFVSLPLIWIELATNKCKQNIEKSINWDESVKTGTNQARFSSSALDSEGFLLQLGLFWKNLEWPVATDAIGYLVTIIEQISQLSLHYVDSLYQSLLQNYSIMYDETGKFRSSEKLCAILNNIYHIKKMLVEMPVTLKLDSYYTWLEDNCKELGGKAKKIVRSLLSSHDEDIENKLAYFVDRISERLTPDIYAFFEVLVPAQDLKTNRSVVINRIRSTSLAEVFSWPWKNKDTEDQLTNEEAITPLLNYLTINLQVLGDSLLTPVLNSILFKLWNMIIGVVQGRLNVLPRKQSVLYLYERLEYFMRELKEFFHADGNGMNLENLETEAYKFIISKLNLMQSSAQDLQQRYLWELSQQQKYLGNGSVIDRGSLEVSVGYLIDKEEIELSVIQAKNLPSNMLLSTYVEVHMFVNCKSAKKIHRTAVARASTNPFYAEEFNLPAKKEEMTVIGTVLLLLVCQSDTNSILGLAVVHGLEIPQLYAHVESLSAQENVPERKKLTRALFLQKKSLALKEVEERVAAHEQDMVEFYRNNKRVFSATMTEWDLHQLTLGL